jgi:glycine cleavage system aminomethyltransferase T
MTIESLEDKIQRHGNIADMLRNAPQGPYDYPMRNEHSNWRDEQLAWKKTSVLYDQSFHMTDIYFQGPDVKRLFSDLESTASPTLAATRPSSSLPATTTVTSSVTRSCSGLKMTSTAS